jgi:hypothetical protein
MRQRWAAAGLAGGKVKKATGGEGKRPEGGCGLLEGLGFDFENPFLFSLIFKTVLVFENKTKQSQTIFKTVKHLK